MQSSYNKHDIKDYIGKRFGHFVVIGQSISTHKFSNKYDFQCDCGNIISEIPSRVIYGHRKSCGKCNFKNSNSQLQDKIDSMSGIKISMLTILGSSKIPESRKTYVKCKCDCGNIINVLPNSIFRNGIKNCGCVKLNTELLKNSQSTSIGNYIDGRTKHPLYGTWQRMIDRCENPNTKHYDRYGGRGIKVCDEWHDFWKFVEWSDSVGGRPKGFTIDRIDNDGNYEPSNCRWADWNTQTSNKSSNRFIEFNGKKQTIHQWALELGINEETLRGRISRGWSVEKALTAKSYIGNNQYTSKK